MAETPLVWMTSGSRGGPGKLRATCRRVLMALAMTVFVGGCEMINSSEQLLIKELAERHVNDHAADPSVKRRPVIVIPGILGSRLKTADTGQVVWGQFGFGGVLWPSKEQTVIKTSVPINLNSSDDVIQDDLVVDGVVQKMPFYILPLMPFGIGVYHEMVSQLENLGYCKGQTCYSNASSNDRAPSSPWLVEFSYDWRLSNAHNAAELQEFIDQNALKIAKERGLSEDESATIDFDIVCHSMGCLVARYFLRYGNQALPDDGQSLPSLNWSGSKRVKNLVMVAPPNAGSLGAVQTLRRGLFVFGFGYSSSVLATMPSLYELLPRRRHRSIIDEEGRALDPLNITIWEDNEWGPFAPEEDMTLQILLPKVSDQQERLSLMKEQMKKHMNSASQFQRAIDQDADPPPGLNLWLFAGKSKDTPSRLRKDVNGEWNLGSEVLGDGVVLSESALMNDSFGSQDSTSNADGPIGWSGVIFLFSDHLDLAGNPEFIVNLDHILDTNSGGIPSMKTIREGP